MQPVMGSGEGREPHAGQEEAFLRTVFMIHRGGDRDRGERMGKSSMRKVNREIYEVKNLSLSCLKMVARM